MFMIPLTFQESQIKSLQYIILQYIYIEIDIIMTVIDRSMIIGFK